MKKNPMNLIMKKSITPIINTIIVKKIMTKIITLLMITTMMIIRIAMMKTNKILYSATS